MARKAKHIQNIAASHVGVSTKTHFKNSLSFAPTDLLLVSLVLFSNCADVGGVGTEGVASFKFRQLIFEAINMNERIAALKSGYTAIRARSEKEAYSKMLMLNGPQNPKSPFIKYDEGNSVNVRRR